MVQVLLVEEPDGTVSYLGNYNTGLQSWKDLDYDYEYQPYKIFLPVCMTIPILHHLTSLSIFCQSSSTTVLMKIDGDMVWLLSVDLFTSSEECPSR
jgi:hypothetical protein